MTMDNSNILVYSGDSLLISTRPNNRGSYDISSLSVQLDGVSSDIYCKVYLRTYSNGIFFSDWVYIGSAVLSSSTLVTDYHVGRYEILQIKLERIGEDENTCIEFKRIDIDGRFYNEKIDTPTLDGSILGDIANDVNVDRIETNLFKKLYYRGIVPNYITRGQNLNKKEDEDYIALFSTIARFFALIIRFFKRWEEIHNNTDMLKEILRNNGIQFDESKITLEELQYLTQHLYSEISKRGTLEMFKYKGDIRKDNSVVDIDGEFLRTIRADKTTEHLFETIPNYEMGWCLGHSSPMYRGISNDCFDLDKLGFSSHTYSDISEWDNIPLFGTYELVRKDPDSDEKVLNFSSGSGIGRLNASAELPSNLINVDTALDYEIIIGFRISNSNTRVYATIEGFNHDRIKIPDAFILPDYSTIASSFFNSSNYLNCNKLEPNQWYYIRFIIKSYKSSPDSYDGKLNIGFGNELFFYNSFVRYILPTIRFTSGSADVCNFHIRPLVRGTNLNPLRGQQNSGAFSLGLIQVSRVFHMYLRNNNTIMTQGELKEFINRYLLPYNSANILTFLNR